MEMSSRISNQATRNLEDDNFIIGTGLKYDRMRRDARQLQRSKFKETRSKANFARFRNAALKCSVEATEKGIEQEKFMRMKEIERERGKLIAIQKKCDKSLLTAKLNPIVPENKLKVKEKRKISRKTILIEETTGDVHSLNPSSACAESWMQRNHFADLDSCCNDLMTTSDPKEKDSFRSEVKTSSKSNTGLLEVGQFTPYSQSTLSRKRGSLPSLSDTSSVSSSPVNDEPKRCPSGLCRSSSTKTIGIHSVDANVKRRNTISTARHMDDTKREKFFAKEKKKEFQVWENFDELLKWFADFMQIEYKPRLVINESDVTKDAHAQNARVLMPKGSIGQLYFQYGMPENFVIRLC